MPYDELVKRLWECASGECFNCSQYTETTNASVCSKELMKQAADAIEELAGFVQEAERDRDEYKERLYKTNDLMQKQWIPVTERLPKNDQDVLVMVHWRDYPEDMMCYGRKHKTRWYLWNGELGEIIKGFDITHWMPLPEPPREEI